LKNIPKVSPRKNFLQKDVQDGTIRQIEIIGEATKNISEALKERYPHIPWRDCGDE
jgi:uncharacterized protein with HEPN domain